MKFFKVKLHENCQMLAVVDNDDTVFAAAAFTSEQDLEAAGDLVYTLLANLGLLKVPFDLTKPQKINEVLGEIAKTCGDFKTYVQDFSVA